MAPTPLRILTRLLQIVSSRDASSAAIGDIAEEYCERDLAGRTPRLPRVWINLQTFRAIGLTMLAGTPRSVRAGGLLLRDAWRALRAAPASSLFIVLVLALGITVSTVTYSVVDAVLLKPLPLAQPDQLVTISVQDSNDTSPFSRTPNEVYWRLHDNLSTLDGLSARSAMLGVNITVAGLTDTMAAYSASADFFPMMRWTTALGRTWTAADEAAGTRDVAVLGYAFWRNRLKSDPDVLGKELTVGKRTFQIIGVLAADTDHPELDLTSAPVWIPKQVPRSNETQAFFGISARMKPGVSVAQLTDDIRAVSGLADPDITIRPLLDQYVNQISQWMLFALGAAAMVLLIACVNAANLMLTRASRRSQELAIRTSLGASRRRIAGALLMEGVLLSFGSTCGALLISIGGIHLARVAIISMLPGMFRASTITLDGRVLLVATLIAVVTGLLVSIVPAWHTSRAPVSSLLKDAESATASGRRRWRSVFLTTEVATVSVLMVIAWLFVVSLIRVVNVDLGIERNNLLAVAPRLSFQGTVAEVEARLRALPGVSDVAISTAASLPLIGRAYGGAWHETKLERWDGLPMASEEGLPKVYQYRVTPNFFNVAGVPFRKGGTWSADLNGEASPIVLDEVAARHLFGDSDPIGRRVRSTEPEGVFTVVGTVAHVYTRGAEDPDPPLAYFNAVVSPTRTFAGLFVKTSRPANEMLPVVNAALESVAPDVNEPFVFLADDAVSRITATRRFNGSVMALLGVIGVLIGAAGVYAVMASFVAQQTREIGVRVALGATPGTIQRGVLRTAWRHMLVGMAIGLPTAWWLSQGLAALLFRVTPADASVYLGVSTILCGVGFVAAWIPARRAARIDPIISLRQ